MADKKEERYTLMGPGGKISAIVMEAGEFNLFGNSCTTIITRETDKYPVIPDEPGKLEVVDNTDLMSGIGHGIANGLLMGAGVALFAGLTAATGGATLIFAGFLLGGASFGVSAATDGMVESDRETGNDRSWGDFALGLAGGGAAGATTGAILYGTVMYAPVTGMAAGMDASAILGMVGVSAPVFTGKMMPAIITGGGYGLAATTALYVENDIRAKSGGYNPLLDKVFQNDMDRYEECGLLLTYGCNEYMEYGTTNMYRMPGGNGRQSLSNNQSVQKLKAQNGLSGTGGGNGGSGGGASLNGTGGQTKRGVLIEGENDSILYIPRDANGNPIPLNKQSVNGQDIPLPDPAAEGRMHTVLGGKVGSATGEVYRQSATFPKGTWPTANGKGVPWSEVHWTDHGTPHHHTNPHQHIFEYNPDKGGWIRRGPTIFEP